MGTAGELGGGGLESVLGRLGMSRAIENHSRRSLLRIEVIQSTVDETTWLLCEGGLDALNPGGIWPWEGNDPLESYGGWLRLNGLWKCAKADLG
jgi:hypothetical protein